MVKPQPHNHLRKQIAEENLLQYKDKITDCFSSRNLSIVEEYMSGSSITELGRKYNITPQRIRMIIHTYIRYCYAYMRRNKIPI